MNLNKQSLKMKEKSNFGNSNHNLNAHLLEICGKFLKANYHQLIYQFWKPDFICRYAILSEGKFVGVLKAIN